MADGVQAGHGGCGGLGAAARCRAGVRATGAAEGDRDRDGLRGRRADLSGVLRTGRGGVRAGRARAAVAGTLIGALAYTGGNVWPARRGGRHRKRSGHQRAQAQPSEAEQGDPGPRSHSARCSTVCRSPRSSASGCWTAARSAWRRWRRRSSEQQRPRANTLRNRLIPAVSTTGRDGAPTTAAASTATGTTPPGFKPGPPAVLYLMVHIGLGAAKVGICNEGSGRMRDHERNRWKQVLITTWSSVPGRRHPSTPGRPCGPRCRHATRP